MLLNTVLWIITVERLEEDEGHSCEDSRNLSFLCCGQHSVTPCYIFQVSRSCLISVTLQNIWNGTGGLPDQLSLTFTENNPCTALMWLGSKSTPLASFTLWGPALLCSPFLHLEFHLLFQGPTSVWKSPPTLWCGEFYHWNNLFSCVWSREETLCIHLTAPQLLKMFTKSTPFFALIGTSIYISYRNTFLDD